MAVGETDDEARMLSAVTGWLRWLVWHWRVQLAQAREDYVSEAWLMERRQRHGGEFKR